MSEEFFNADTSEWVDYGPPLDIGPQTGGTYNIPESAQQNNLPYDTPGGVVGRYGSDVLGILSQGIGVWSQYQRNKQFIDYQRYEATNGGIFMQGRPAGQMQAAGSVQVRGNNNMMLLVLGVGLFLMMRK